MVDRIRNLLLSLAMMAATLSGCQSAGKTQVRAQKPEDNFKAAARRAIIHFEKPTDDGSAKPRVVFLEIKGEEMPERLPVGLTAKTASEAPTVPARFAAPVFDDPESNKEEQPKPVEVPEPKVPEEPKTPEEPKGPEEKPKVPEEKPSELEHPQELPNPKPLAESGGPVLEDSPVLMTPKCRKNVLSSPNHRMGKFPRPLPSEMSKVTMPDYVIEPPDILLVESPKSLPDQPIGGEHLVRPDGTISLGLYGSVRVAGLTLTQAREAVAEHLTSFFKQRPQINMDVYAYNSKAYYIIMDGAGFGEQVVRLSHTGNETVLDAIANVGGLPVVAAKKRIWIARPLAPGSTCNMVLPVDWNAIVQCGQTQTNYQIFPGDRLYVQSDRLMALDGLLNKITTPINRVMGTALLGGVTVQQFKNLGRFIGLGGGVNF